jgi:hypothetical protein
MKFVFILLLSLSASAADPIPFEDPLQDGFVWTLWHEGYSEAQLDWMLDRLKQTGAKHIQVPVWGCQTSLISTDIGACEVIPRDFAFQQVDRAIAKGFNTSILPIMTTKDWGWRGEFHPTDLDQWFAAYTRWIVDLAREARTRGMKEFVMASEFKSLLPHEARWRKVIAEVRKEFHGPVIYTANWDATNIRIWDAVDAIGVSAYFPLAQGLNPPQDELDRSWKEHKKTLLKLAKKWKRPLHFTEFGYSNTDSAAKSPWDHADNDIVNEALQTRCFEAFSKTWSKEPQLVRANVWSYGGPENQKRKFSGDPVGKPAEAVIREFFEARSH